MATETETLQAFEDAIVDFTYPATNWVHRVYYSDKFAPTGQINRNRAPFIIFPNGVESDIDGVTSETFQGEFTFTMWVVIAAGIINVKKNRTDLAVFSQEIINACKPVVDELLTLSIGFGETQVLKGMIGRELNVTYGMAECK